MSIHRFMSSANGHIYDIGRLGFDSGNCLMWLDIVFVVRGSQMFENPVLKELNSVYTIA